ncbi:hypothetical protein F0562_006900 [Nyssa sinensis]|uniref:Protein kinase domain-containing protein n=1 Tax=Nyssa sinensis TaxID=561372 RepID=A0A5J5AP29_9ASTE|nr:hypothetical protein F0562_006900 [Nyssa sinensis]
MPLPLRPPSMATIVLLVLSVIISPFLSCAQRSAETLSEIEALTSFKLNLHDPLGALNSWDSSTPLAPCDWRGVDCSSGRVSELRLPRLQLGGRLTEQISNLRMLRKLSLRSNFFNHTIPSSLSTCTLLHSIFLQYNSFSGNLPPDIGNLTNLQILNVAQNQLSGEVPGDLPRSLRYIDLSSNAFSGDIPKNVSSLSQLQLINLSYNRFSGEIPANFGELQQLQYLWLDYNVLEGTLPSAIANCSSLVHLSAEGNTIQGVIPSAIGALPKLQVISLSHNNLSGSVPSSMFCNVSVYPPSIRIVQLGFNAFTDIVATETATCFSILQVLDLQQNQIHGVFPSWFTNISTLTMLDVSGNRFMGEIPAFLSELRGLKMLSLGGNQLSGSIPSSFGNLTQLETLNLGGNFLTGAFPEELMGLSNLTTLNLSGNRFSGGVPTNIGSLKQLSVLNISGNGFSGIIPASVGALYKLTTLDLSKQNLSGELPFDLAGLPNLQVIALQENRLSGNVPEGFSSLLSLRYLNLSSNSFFGHIPSTFGFLKSLVVLSLSKNQISGSIPPEIGNCSDLQILDLHSNSLSGQIPIDLSRLSNFKELNLGRNSLTGEIPVEISKISSLTSLLLYSNHLSGSIPESLSNLSNLTTLDLSVNNLSGVIPANLSLISSIVNFNVSQNNLEGEIPVILGSRFNNPSDFAGNLGLCGKPLDGKCEEISSGSRRKKLILLTAVAIAGACLMALCCCFYIFSLLRWRKRLKEGAAGEKKRSPARASSGASVGRGSGDNGGPKLVMFNNKITLAETVEATRQFDEENVLSRTRYGLVFKGCYNDGMVLSIRRLPDGSLEENMFRKEAESLGRVKHRNLTVLRGYYAGPPDLRLLVFDYMPNGNLATLLQEASHQDGHVLNWPMRHLIALGIARGLAFLHTASMVHRDVKPQNVLFDADFEAHLSDFGLERFMVATPAEPSTSTSVGTLGYVSPEAGLTGEATKESDVYSFGIVLLELLTGKRPVMFTQDEDIVKWVKRQLQRGQITELLEPGLLELDPESSEWEEFLLGVKVGLLCTAPDPLDRPSMSDIVFMLEGCRVGPDIPSSADPTSQPSPA